MAKCEVCGKGTTFGIKVSHSHRRSNRTWKANVRKVRALVNGTPKRVNVCSRCLRSNKIVRAIWLGDTKRYAEFKWGICLSLQIPRFSM